MNNHPIYLVGLKLENILTEKTTNQQRLIQAESFAQAEVRAIALASLEILDKKEEHMVSVDKLTKPRIEAVLGNQASKFLYLAKIEVELVTKTEKEQVYIQADTFNQAYDILTDYCKECASNYSVTHHILSLLLSPVMSYHPIEDEQ